jgi:hypothetical protein
MIAPTVLILSALQLVSAHFEVFEPYWRASSFIAPASQYLYPCKLPFLRLGRIISLTSLLQGAGIDQSVSANNRTLWPLDGGSISLGLHHPWTYVFINLGLGSNVTTTFNISLTANLFNTTGAGTLCIPKWTLPSNLGIQEGTNASLQFVTSGASGSALYNVSCSYSPPLDSRFHFHCKTSSSKQPNLTGLPSYSAPISPSAARASFSREMLVKTPPVSRPLMSKPQPLPLQPTPPPLLHLLPQLPLPSLPLPRHWLRAA